MSLTAGTALSLHAIRNPARPPLQINLQLAAASQAPVLQVHTASMLTAETAPEPHEAAPPVKSAAADFYDVQPAPAAGTAERSESDNRIGEKAERAVPPVTAPPTITSLLQGAVENSTDQPSTATTPRSPKAPRTAVARARVEKTAHTISPARAKPRKPRLAARPAIATVQAPDGDEIHNPLVTITELLQRGL